MPSDRPNATEILETVREFLMDRALPALEGHVAFEARIAANLLAIAERELEHEPALVESERQRLQEILGHEGSHADLEHELVELIRARALGSGRDVILDHLRRNVEARLRIANPKHLERG